jgi:hypothetical protein
MPAGFNRCRANGGQIFTKTLSGGRYQHYCYDPRTHKRYMGEIKKKKSTRKRRLNRKKKKKKKKKSKKR